MNPQATNGLLAAGAVMVGWWAWGWQGLLFAVSVIAFWLLLQFTRAVRALRHAGQRPIGHVDSAVMLQSRLSHGMNIQEVIALTGSLGRKVGSGDDWQWADPGGSEVTVFFRQGRVVRWSFQRSDEPAPPDGSSPAPPSGAD